MSVDAGAALVPSERRAVATLSAVYATRMLGLFLLLPVLALHAGSLPGGTPLMAGLAVGAYGLTQALLQIPFGMWSDRWGRRPLIVAGLSLQVLGSALGWAASSAWALVAARAVQGLGAVSGPALALLADLTRPAVRTRAMAIVGISIGASFVLSLVAGPALAGWIGVRGVFAATGLLGLLALLLVLVALPAGGLARRAPRPGPAIRDALARGLWPHYAGVLVLHLTLTATFISVPLALRDLHGIPGPEHWRSYLPVFALSLLLTLPLLLWSERTPRTRLPLLAAGLLLAAAQAAIGLGHGDRLVLLAALVGYFGAFNFLEARLPASLSAAAGEELRGAALGLFATCQFLGAFAGGALGGLLLAAGSGIGGVSLVAGAGALGWALLAARAEANGAGRGG